jgi:hypothetical protein
MSDPTFEEVLAALKEAGENSLASDFEWLREFATQEDRAKIMQALADLDRAYELKAKAELVLDATLGNIECRYRKLAGE